MTATDDEKPYTGQYSQQPRTVGRSADIAKLIERIEKATESDAALDIELANAIGKEGTVWVHDWPTVPPYTASLDAAIALCERVLPGWERTIKGGGDTPAYVELGVVSDGSYFPQVDANAKTEPLALLLAMLRALQQQEPKNE